MLVKPVTPPEHIPQTHWTTPSRSALQHGFKLLEQNRADPTRPSGLNTTQLLSVLGIPRTTAYRIAKAGTARRSSKLETRGRKRILTEKDIDYLELLILRGGFDGRTLTFETLAQEIDVEVSARTIRRTFKQLQYRRCLACRRTWVHPKLAQQRVEFARKMLARFPTSDDWKQVRFSDETHLGFGAPGRIWVIRKPGERTCADYI